jgi:hypothetical protein
MSETPKMEDISSSTATITEIKPKQSKKKAAATELDLISKVANEIENLTPDQVFKQGREIQADNDFNLFKIGGLISVAWHKKLHADFGYDSHEDYIKAEFANLSSSPYRKARYLRAIYENLVQEQIKWESVKDLGWTKLSVLSPILTEDNVEDIVSKCKGMTVLQIQEWKKAQAVQEPNVKIVETEESDISSFTLKVHGDQKETIKKALEKSKAEFGTDYDAVAMDHICMGYLTGALGKAKKSKTFKEQMQEMSAEDVLAVFESCFPNIKLAAEEVEVSETSVVSDIPFADDSTSGLVADLSAENVVYEEEV